MENSKRKTQLHIKYSGCIYFNCKINIFLNIFFKYMFNVYDFNLFLFVTELLFEITALLF